MIMDDKGRLFGKLNLLDFVIILIIIGLLAFGGVYFSRNKNADNSYLKVRYTVEVTSKDLDYFNHIVTGEKVEDGKTKEKMGKVVSYEKKPAKVFVENKNAKKIESAQVEGKYDGYIVIELDAGVEYPDILSGSETIKIGKAVTYRSESAAITGYIVNIDYDEEELRRLK